MSTSISSNEAKIILNWDDGTFYLADNDYHTDIIVKGQTTATATTAKNQNTGGVKVPEWDQSYKYNVNDIVAFSGIMYVSKQNQNQNNAPNNGTFWWNNVFNLSSVDAITIEGKNLKDIFQDILGGNKITDYYKKSEVENILLDATNSINAKRLENLTLSDIRKEYTALTEVAKIAASAHTSEYLHSSDDGSFDKEMAAEFDKIIVADSINQI